MINFLTQNISTYGVVLLGIWMLYKELRSGNSKLTNKMLADYKERNGQLEEAAEELKTIIADYKVEVAKLQASNIAQEKHNKELRDLLLDKNPEVIKVLEEIRDFLKKSDEKNDKVLGYQTTILEEWKERSDKVDEASKKHIGEPMLVPAV
jgi:DNA-binding transcriptional regulator YiaG